MYIRDFLNKIKWDKNLNPRDYEIVYYDRILDKKLAVRFTQIKETDKNFILVDDKDIPLHRIKEIRKKGKLVWSR